MIANGWSRPQPRVLGGAGSMGFTWDLEGCVSGGAPRDRACGRSGDSREGIFRAARETIRVFASKAPSGSVPLPLLSRYNLVGRKVMAQQILS